MISFSDFATQEIGKNNIGDTPQNIGECVGLVEAWLDAIGAPHIWGNACDLPANADRNAFNVIPNTEAFVPSVGDIGVLPAGWDGSDVGHCFIVAPGTTVNTLVVLEQNDRIDGGDGSVRLFDDIGWPVGLVFIHPYVLDVVAPVVSPEAPTPQLPVESQPSPAPDAEVPTPAPVADTPQTDDQSVDSSTADPTPVPAPENPPVIPPVFSSRPIDDISTIDTTSSSEVSNKPTIIKDIFSMIKVNAHQLSVVLGYAVVIIGAIQGFLSSDQTVTLAGIITAVAGAVEHRKVSNS